MDEVHPRSRGEIAIYNDGQLIANGSPPLARGNLTPILPRRTLSRFTPARAGKSQPPNQTPE